jgi:hypothetical protein
MPLRQKQVRFDVTITRMNVRWNRNKKQRRESGCYGMLK